MKKYREQAKLLPRLTSDDIKGSTNMKMVFVTSSPVLTNEVKQYYANLKQQLAAHLLVVEKARDELKQNGSSLDKEEEKKRDDEDKVMKDNLREKMIKLTEIKEQEILQAEQLDQQLDLPEKASLYGKGCISAWIKSQAGASWPYCRETTLLRSPHGGLSPVQSAYSSPR